MQPDHNPETVCLIGMGPSIQDYMQETLTQELKPDHHDEIWGINMVGNCIRCDLIFWMDDLAHQAGITPHRKTPTGMLKALFSQPLALQMGEQPSMADLIRDVQGFPEWIPTLEYHEVSNGFAALFREHFSHFPYAVFLEATKIMDAELKLSVVDEDRSLKGLMEVLDRHKTPVMTSIRRPEVVEHCYDYPLDPIARIGIEAFGKPYLANGVAMAIAYAIHKKVKFLKLYGCDFTYPDRNFAEEGRACCEAWLTLAATKYDMKIGASPRTSLFDLARDKGIYGYAEQPPIDLGDGKIWQYQKTGQQIDENGKPYLPENSSGVADGQLKETMDVSAPLPGSDGLGRRAGGPDGAYRAPAAADEAGAAP